MKKNEKGECKVSKIDMIKTQLMACCKYSYTHLFTKKLGLYY